VNDYQKQWEKIRLNAELPLAANDTVRTFDPALAASITEEAQAIIAQYGIRFEYLTINIGDK
jgi:hypothetical protein